MNNKIVLGSLTNLNHELVYERDQNRQGKVDINTLKQLTLEAINSGSKNFYTCLVFEDAINSKTYTVKYSIDVDNE